MSWIQKLYDTYEHCSNNSLLMGVGDKLLPLDHTTQNVQIEVVIDGNGKFIRACVVEKNDAPTLIPCTEKSSSRAGKKPEPHPLCDKLQYLAQDFRKFGGIVTIGFHKDEDQPFKDYFAQLQSWVKACPHPKLEAIVSYLQKGNMIADLVRASILPTDAEGNLLKSATKEKKESFHIWNVLAANQRPEDAFVRWKVEMPGHPDSATWQDLKLIESWGRYSLEQADNRTLCMVTGKNGVPVARLHPARLRHPGDRAKLISANDENGFTFRGRFTDTTGLQACSVGYDVTQKAHSALQWLIARQGYRSGSQAYVSWAVSGAPVPSPLEDTRSMLADDLLEDLSETSNLDPKTIHPASAIDHTRDVGQSFALTLRKAMIGYGATLAPTEDIVIIGLDSATPGRMSIILYRELMGSAFLKRLENWHLALAWPQRVVIKEKILERKKSKTRVEWHVFAPAPRVIAEAAYGRRLDAKLRSATIERVLACIIDGREIPHDLIECCVRRATNRAGMEHWDWQQALGVACAMYKGYFERYPIPEKRRAYSMALEHERSTRDYLYGRLLALADHIENMALYVGGENRPTTAARLMQRFADRPYSTWRTIEMALQPSMLRLKASRPGFLWNIKNLIDEIYGMFAVGDFTNEARLSGEFLLGYHCQLQALQKKKDKESKPDTKEMSHE